MSQDEQCFACGRQFRKNGHGRIVFHPTALTIDGQRPFVGHDCFRRITDAGIDGWQPPQGGPRLWNEYDAPEEARRAAGIVLTIGAAR